MTTELELELEVGDLYENCSYHVCKATKVDYEDDTIEGQSLFQPDVSSNCSIIHCGIVKLTQEEAEELMEIYKISGINGIMLFRGWTQGQVAEWDQRLKENSTLNDTTEKIDAS